MGTGYQIPAHVIVGICLTKNFNGLHSQTGYWYISTAIDQALLSHNGPTQQMLVRANYRILPNLKGRSEQSYN